MTRQAWRIVKAKYVSTAFTGEGARRYGGRWNSKGVPVVYVSDSCALAVLEYLVHLEGDAALRSHQQAYRLIGVRFDDSLVESMDPADLPKNWRAMPLPPETQRLGDRWVAEQRSAVLQVPSAIVPQESNYVLNPSHSDFARIKIGKPRPFRIDPRLTKRP